MLLYQHLSSVSYYGYYTNPCRVYHNIVIIPAIVKCIILSLLCQHLSSVSLNYCYCINTCRVYHYIFVIISTFVECIILLLYQPFSSFLVLFCFLFSAVSTERFSFLFWSVGTEKNSVLAGEYRTFFRSGRSVRNVFFLFVLERGLGLG